MTNLIEPELIEYVGRLGPKPDSVLREMHEEALERSFPHVGPVLGGFLEFFADIISAKRIFEFGSGFGYSAYWFARSMSDDGTIIMTDTDADNLERAQYYFKKGGQDEKAIFEHGDAMDVISRYDGQFDIVLIDHEKQKYLDALDAVRDKLRPGGLVIADNTVSKPVDFDDLAAYFAGNRLSMDDQTSGVAAFLTDITEDPDVSTVILPYGSGMSVSRVQG